MPNEHDQTLYAVVQELKTISLSLREVVSELKRQTASFNSPTTPPAVEKRSN